jgi:uncharacterized DUF497 family protein
VKIKFEWGENENIGNQKKHCVAFEEAVTIFSNFPLEVFLTLKVQ